MYVYICSNKKLKTKEEKLKFLQMIFLIWNDRRFIEDYSLSVRMVQKKNVSNQFLEKTKFFRRILSQFTCIPSKLEVVPH
jgi:hypothetical protein